MSTPIEKKPTPPAGTPERGEPLRQIVAAASEPASSHLGARLRSYFLTGLIVVGPVAITIYVVWWFITLVDAWVKPLIPPQYLPEHYLPFNVPGVGLIFGITGVMLVGALTANLFGRTLVTYSEMMLARMPIVRNVYRTLKQIFETVLSKNGGSFKRVGLIEFPRHGLYAIVFFAGEPPLEVEEKIGDGNPMITVFMPNGAEPDHWVHHLRAGERGDPARSVRRGCGQTRGVGGPRRARPAGAAARACQAQAEARARGRACRLMGSTRPASAEPRRRARRDKAAASAPPLVDL